MYQVIAFSDEEGVRFQCTFLGSAALAGIMPVSRLEITDKRFYSKTLASSLSRLEYTILTFFHIHSLSGITVQDALKENSIDITEENLMQLKYDPASVWGYVEVIEPFQLYIQTSMLITDWCILMQVHIEQGPVLEYVGYPLGVVKGIAGQTRLKVTYS